jgi:hypothetical protein
LLSGFAKTDVTLVLHILALRRYLMPAHHA